MAKKLICMLAIMMTLAVIFAVGVSANEYYYENFADVTPSYSSNKAHVYISVPNLSDGTPTAEFGIVDGTLHMEKSSYAQTEQTAIGNKVPEVRLNYSDSAANADEMFIEFDFMFGDNAKMTAGGEVITYVYAKDKRFLVQIGFKGLILNFGQAGSLPVLSQNVWYSGLMHVRFDDGMIDTYQKVKGTDTYSFVQSAALSAQTKNNYYLQLYGDYRKDLDTYFDNVKIYDGIVSKGGFYEMDGVNIDDTDDVTAGTLTVNTEVLNGAMSETAVYPVITVFDANGRLLDCQIKTDFSLVPGTNDISVDYDVSEYGDSVSGGYVGFYLWKDMTSVRPLVDAVELK